MREFVVKSKKLRVTIEGVSHEMRCPTLGDGEIFQEKLEAAKPNEALGLYRDFFESLGLPKEVSSKMDLEDFLEFIQFVMVPKKKESLASA